ncbi:uncharacterized mitochondrial protein AtMg00240-like [Humulus lupulus]|uniref:uncharacterized mitochondrial protein AtMg00240-like n=1 Tax=Humulus lupulus TaxID=3486 RepID=UPI002B40AA3E|nr:uncharacterized mitochondrial protein AtMg00240-like [Humulus lupulus]
MDSKAAPTSGLVSKPLSQHDGDSIANPSKYRRVVESLQYVTMTRLDIAFVVHKACQFMQQPTSAHWLAVKRILRYLRGTPTHGILITITPSLHISTFNDADWASSPDDRRSTGGFCVFLGDCLLCLGLPPSNVLFPVAAPSPNIILYQLWQLNWLGTSIYSMNSSSHLIRFQ